jgi:hypothetical protein
MRGGAAGVQSHAVVARALVGGKVMLDGYDLGSRDA